MVSQALDSRRINWFYAAVVIGGLSLVTIGALLPDRYRGYLIGAIITAILLMGFFVYVSRGQEHAWNGVIVVLGFGVLVYQLERTVGFPFPVIYGVGLLATAAPVLLKLPSSKRFVTPSFYETLIAAFLVYLLAEVWNPNQQDLLSAVLALRHYVIGVLLYFCVRRLVVRPEQIVRLLWITSILGFVAALYGIVQGLLGWERLHALNSIIPGVFDEMFYGGYWDIVAKQNYFRVMSTFQWWGSLAMYMVLAVTANVTLLMADKKHRRYLVISSATMIICLFLTYTITAFVTLPVSLIAIAVRFGRKGARILLALIPGGIIIFFALNILLGGALLPRLNSAFDISGEKGGTWRGRLQQVRMATLVTRDDVLFGNGLASHTQSERFAARLGMNYESRMLSIQPWMTDEDFFRIYQDLRSQGRVTLAVDSPYLIMFMELGIIGLILFLAVLVGGIIKGWGTISRLNDVRLRALGIGITAWLIAFAFANLANIVITSVPTGTYFWVFLAIVMNLKIMDSRSSQDARHHPPDIAAAQ